MVKDIIISEQIDEKYPMRQEEKRGLIRLFGRGEGLNLAQGYDKNSVSEHAFKAAFSKRHPEVLFPEDTEWEHLNSLTPPDFENMIEVRHSEISQNEMPPLDRETVLDLVDSYMENMNIKHPILVPRQVYALVESFLKSIPQSQPKHVNPDNLRQKQEEFPGFGESTEPGIQASEYSAGHPFRSISTALVLLMLALGKICQYNAKIPNVASDRQQDTYGSPYMYNCHILSSSGQDSPILSTVFSDYQPRDLSILKNLHAIPGLTYFALATDIMGNQLGINSLQHVHANILAGLYHGQLARVLESHTYIYKACRSLQVILQPELERFRSLKQNMQAVPVKDNPLVFTFWTCLQLER